MNELRVDIYKDGRIETSVYEWKNVYSNSSKFVYEDKHERIEVFDNDKKSCLHRGLDELGVVNWLNDKYFGKIVFCIYSEKTQEKLLKVIKKEIEKYLKNNYGFMQNIDYSKITLEQGE